MIFEIENLNSNKITILGHKGMGSTFMYPGNSYESIEPCLRIGADGSEIDVQMTKDSGFRRVPESVCEFHSQNGSKIWYAE